MLACTAPIAGCGPRGFSAELLEKDQRVERDFARAQNAWSNASSGDRLQMGDGLRTGTGAHALLALPGGGKLLVKSDTIVRFAKSLEQGAPGEQLEVLQGELTIETGSNALGVKTARGLVRLDRQSSIVVQADPRKTRFDVRIGRVDYSVDGGRKTAAAGSSFELDVLAASVETAPQPSAASTPAALSGKALAPDAGGAAGAARASNSPEPEVTWAEPPPGALVTFHAGDTVTIHDPAPPSDVRVLFRACVQGSPVLELDRGNRREPVLRVRASAEGELRARVPRGTFRYRVSCAGGPAGTAATQAGQLSVLPDAATRPLPLAPVTITADADGRRYSVSYQNRLPTVTLRWPYAPRADTYRLFVQPAAAERFEVDARQASVTLPPGRLGEGLHRFWFETPAHKRSETGVLQVSFDYTARTAYLTSPRDGDALQGGRSRFTGGTLLGSTVHVQGAPLKLDAHGRFAAAVEIAAAVDGAAVRVAHPSTGIHYYVRHLAR
jgi:hypothetical protein